MVGISLEGKEKATRSVNKLNYNRKSQVVEEGRQHQCVPTDTRQGQTTLQYRAACLLQNTIEEERDARPQLGRAPSTVQRETERTREANPYEYDRVAPANGTNNLVNYGRNTRDHPR